jgi:hypothetical protein
MAEKYSPGTRPTDGKNLVWFGEIERKLAKLSLPTFTYRSSSLCLSPCADGKGGKERDNARKKVFALNFLYYRFFKYHFFYLALNWVVSVQNMSGCNVRIPQNRNPP